MKKPTRARAARRRPAASARAAFPIVGIGASAGGLEALETFLKNVPAKTAMAFVVVQHLDPTHKGLLVELLQRASPMSVVQVKDGTRVVAGRVYVIPPNKDMSIVHGVLHLLVPVAPRGLRLPIDFFLRSLADDLGDRSVGVILSGMGSDGTLGLRAIREKAGAGFVQAPESAKFDGMPRSAIESGVADVVAPADQLPAKILAYLQHTGAPRPERAAADEETQGGLEKIIGLLRSATGHDFSLYKRNTIRRRIERRMGLHQIVQIRDYVRFLRENPTESELLFRELLIGVTSFFRDGAPWDKLAGAVLPELLGRSARDAVLRAWVPACSTGEEAYSLGIVFKEALERAGAAENVTLQIFATDLDGDAVETARQAHYPASIAADVSPARLARFFIKDDAGYRVRKELRDLVVFATQNVIRDPPFTRLDLLSCRNLLIYLTPELQHRLMPLFHYSLRPGGILFLGSAETVGPFPDLFSELEGKVGMYRRLEGAAGAAQAGLSPPLGAALRTSRMTPIEPDARAASMPELEALVEKTLQRVLERATEMASSSSARGTPRAEAAAPHQGRRGKVVRADLAQQVQQLRDELRTVREEMQSSQEELKSSNEELQSTNEELQSTNEELTTSKEEMQSMNEELQTLDHELQSKVDELSHTSNDMKNLLDSTEIAVVFLDETLHVRRFTPQVAKLIKLIPGDVGRPLADLASSLEYPALYDDAREVLRSLISKETLVASRAGGRFTARIMPYRTLDNRIDGVVITFTASRREAAR